jgi:hypothetical protein
VLVFPRMVIQFVGLEGRTGHHVGWCRVVQSGVEALPQGVELFSRQPSCACEARRGFTLGHPTSRQHQRRRALSCFFEDSPRQQGRVALTGPAAGGREVPLGPEHAPCGRPTVRAYAPTRLEVMLQPNRAHAVIQKLTNRKVNHETRVTYRAR